MPLSAIAGHQSVVTLLRHAVARESVPQSLLLAGPEGVGKHAVAIAIAQAVNCPNRAAGDAEGPQSNDDACGTCATCQRIARGQHYDVVDLNAGGTASIKIEPLRERVLDVVGYRPFEARRRVFIIDDADMLTVQAQDALLKTLEEPPSTSMLILVTSQPDTLLPTVQSRCRRLRFGLLSDADVARVLTTVRRLDATLARDLAAVAGGSVGRALAESSGQIAEDRDAALALLQASATDRGVPVRLKAAAALVQHGSKRRDREALAARLAILGSLLRDLAAIDAGGPGSDDSAAEGDVADDLQGIAARFDRRRLVDAWTALGTAENALDRNGSVKIIADWLSLRL